MEYTAQKARELEGLRELSESFQRMKTLEESIDACRKERDRLDAAAQKSGHNVQLLPTDNHERMKERIDRSIEKEADDKIFKKQILITVGICILGLITLLLQLPLLLELLQSGNTDESMIAMSMFFSVYFTVAFAIYVNVEYCFPFDGWIEWISVGGFFFFGFCIWAPFVGVILSIMHLIQINVLFAVFPIAAVILLFVGRRVRKHKYEKRGYSETDNKQLSDAAALDSKNASINAQRQTAAVENAKEKNQPRVQKLNKQIYENMTQMDQLKRKIEANPFLSPGDIGRVDRIIHYMSTGRADSIKEALHLVDRDSKAEIDRIWAEFNARNQALQDKWRREEEAEQRERDRLAQRQNAEKITEKLDEMQKEFDYRGRYGW